MRGPRPQCGELWVVNLDPTIGSEIQKARPAVVVNAPVFDLLEIRIVVPLTSWQPRFGDQRNKVRIPKSEQNRLDRDSAADFLQVRAVSTERFVSKIGQLEPALLDEVVAGIVIAVDYRP